MQTSRERDPLTGLFDNQSIEAILAETLASRRSSTFPVGCLLIDIDRFGEINSMYGPEVGNEVLKRVAKLVSNSCRVEDAVGRCPDDEIMVVLPSTPAAGMIVVGERLIRTVTTAYWDDLPGAAEVSISIGGSYVSQGSGISSEELLSIARVRLDSAKEAGRNGMVISAPTVARY